VSAGGWMSRATLTISLPQTMKDFIDERLREGRFSTPSEYIRSLIRDDQDMMGNGEVAVLLRRGAVNVQTSAKTARQRK
jgi:antitoxin ParD1/3/4